MASIGMAMMFAGSASCNRNSGSAQITPEGKLALSAPNAIAVTRMACAQAASNGVS